MVVQAVSEELRRLLWQAFDDDNTLRPIVGSEQAIVLRNPTETARDAANRLSLWLYQITENEFVKNQPMQRSNGGPSPQHDLLRFPPLALNLFYLLTPFGPSGEADHLLLGRAMQVFYDNAIVPLRRPAIEIAEELRITLCRLTLEELTRIWEALREPYRLSLCYQVCVTHIDSLRQPRVAPVAERIAGYRAKDVEERT